MIRLATGSDSAAFLTLPRRLDAQSSFLMYKANEREDELPGVRHRLGAPHDTGSFDLVATDVLNEQPPALVAWLAVEVAALRCLELTVESLRRQGVCNICTHQDGSGR
jgi:hypothetical protein